MSNHPLEDILHPRSIAVIGASESSRGGGFIKPLQELGFKGDIYPVNPKYTEILGMKAYPRVKDIPGPVDYVISSIPAAEVLELIDDCGEKGVKGVHLFTARFGETGRKDAADLEQEILRRAKRSGVRLIGPNCMGVYCPDEGISFIAGVPKESGHMGLASQSGAVASEVIGVAAQRGIRFSKAISYGNAIDFNECDYIEYFTEDPQTKVIMMYIEGVRDGRRFLSSLRRASEKKPVIILKGGRGEAGTRATASHTASMAGSTQLWQAIVDQTGVVSAIDLEELVDIAAAFYFLPEFTGRRVGIAGGSGGLSVMSSDLCEEAGLNVIPLPDDLRKGLKDQGNPVWDWIGNPADFSITGRNREDAFKIIKMMAQHPDFDHIIIFMSGPWQLDKKPFSIDEHLNMYDLDSIRIKPLTLVFRERARPVDGNKEHEELAKISDMIKQRLIAMNLPIYANIGQAARSISKVIEYYEKRQR